ncbi:MAG: Transcriptional regulator, MarR family [Actinotalea sp.]|nr:Transcriptional regulator, MarR family [Actinotalea sp.]
MVLSQDVVDALDDALVAVQRVPRRPGYRRRLLEPLALSGGLGSFRTLRAVERVASDAPTIGEIAEALVVDPSTASRAVERCVADGLLTREAQSTDRRRAHLRLTDAGQEVLAQASRNRRDVLAEVTGEWQEEDVVRLVGQLRALLEGFDRVEAGR